MGYLVQVKINKSTPAKLYDKYLSLTYLLYDNSHQWGLTFYDIFCNAPTKKIRKGVNELKSYVRPDFTRIITHSQQCDALVLLKNEAHTVGDALIEQDDKFR
jgi:hypothetical protein